LGLSEPKQPSKGGIDLEGVDEQGCRWADEQRLLCVTLAEGVWALRRDAMATSSSVLPPNFAMDVWTKALRGDVAEVPCIARSSICRGGGSSIDVTNGRQHLVARAHDEPWSIRLRTGRSTRQSHDGNAYAGMAFFLPTATLRLAFPSTLALYTLDGRPLAFDRPLPRQALMASLRWASDGKSLVFFALEDACVHPALLYPEGLQRRLSQGGGQGISGHL
jgi:hypothetical protein